MFAGRLKLERIKTVVEMVARLVGSSSPTAVYRIEGNLLLMYNIHHDLIKLGRLVENESVTTQIVPEHYYTRLCEQCEHKNRKNRHGGCR